MKKILLDSCVFIDLGKNNLTKEYFDIINDYTNHYKYISAYSLNEIFNKKQIDNKIFSYLLRHIGIASDFHIENEKQLRINIFKEENSEELDKIRIIDIENKKNLIAKYIWLIVYINYHVEVEIKILEPLEANYIKTLFNENIEEMVKEIICENIEKYYNSKYQTDDVIAKSDYYVYQAMILYETVKSMTKEGIKKSSFLNLNMKKIMEFEKSNYNIERLYENVLNYKKKFLPQKSIEEVLASIIDKVIIIETDELLKRVLIFLLINSRLGRRKTDFNDFTDISNIMLLLNQRESIYLTYDKKWIKFIIENQKLVQLKASSSFYLFIENKKSQRKYGWRNIEEYTKDLKRHYEK